MALMLKTGLSNNCQLQDDRHLFGEPDMNAKQVWRLFMKHTMRWTPSPCGIRGAMNTTLLLTCLSAAFMFLAGCGGGTPGQHNPPPPPPPPSLSSTSIPPAKQIVDSNGGVWTIDSGNHCLLNGSYASGGCGSNVQYMLYYKGAVYYVGTGSWYRWNGSSFTLIAADPRGSANGTVVPISPQITDDNGGVWTLVSGSCYLNAAPIGSCSNVQELYWYGGKLYAYDLSGHWSVWNGSAFTSATSPLFDPAAAGYHLAFDGTFGKPGDIDWKNSCQPGFKWYFCEPNGGSDSVDPTNISVDGNGVLAITLHNPAPPNGVVLYSAGGGGGGTGGTDWRVTPPYFVGQVFGGGQVGTIPTGNGFYIEWRIEFDPVAAHTAYVNTHTWPAVWGFSILNQINWERGLCQIPPNGDGWPGQDVSGAWGSQHCFIHHVEDDFYEYFGTTVDEWSAALHDWYGARPVSGVGNNGTHLNFEGTSNSSGIYLPTGTMQAGKYNTFGQLYVAGSAANGYHGYKENYLNGVLQTGRVDWVDAGAGDPSLLTTGTPNGTFAWSWLDTQPQDIHLQGFLGGTMHVAWVRVWQLP